MTIWSVGDLSTSHADYLKFIENKYSGDFTARFRDVEIMIERLAAERLMLMKTICKKKKL